MSHIPFNKPYLTGKEAHYMYHAVTLHELLRCEVNDTEIEALTRKSSHDGVFIVGNLKVLNQENMRSIYCLAN